MEPKPTYTTDAGDVQFYVKATSNCEPLQLTTLHALFGGTWSTWRYRTSDGILLKTGSDLTPRFVVGWTDLYGGIATECAAFERIGDEDEPAWAIVGGNSGLRILANMDESGDFEPAPGAEHLPPGWGSPVLLIEDGGDIVDEGLRKALNLDSGQPYSEPPDWSAKATEPYCQLCGSTAAVVADHPAGPLYYCQRCGTGEYIVMPDGDDAPTELDFDQLAAIARAWPWNVRDALARFVARAMTNAGIDDKRLAVQERLARMMGDI